MKLNYFDDQNCSCDCSKCGCPPSVQGKCGKCGCSHSDQQNSQADDNGQ